MDKQGKCHLCGETKPLCRAHLTPDSFGRWIKKNNSFIEVRENKKKKKQTLAYDKNILCSDCDNVKLGVYDKVFINFCKQAYEHPHRKKPFNSHGKLDDISVIIEIDSMSIQLGIIASIWRHSISSHNPRIDFGNKYNAMFKTWLWTGTIPDNEKHFCKILPILCIDDGLDEYIISPYGGRVGNTFLYYYQIPGMFFFIEIGQQWN